MGVIRAESAERYRWGGPDGRSAEACYLVKADGLHVIEEEIPPGVAETPHLHLRARQFFFVLDGELAMEVEGRELVVRQGEGVEVSPGQRHQVSNRSVRPVRILVVSQPPSHGDRVELA